VLSQLGFIPFDLEVDSLEVSKRCDLQSFVAENKYLTRYNYIHSSDAHYPEDFAKTACDFYLESLSFSEIKKALRGEDGRYVKIL